MGQLGRSSFLLEGVQKSLVRLVVGQVLGGLVFSSAGAGTVEGLWFEMHDAMVSRPSALMACIATNTAPGVTNPHGPRRRAAPSRNPSVFQNNKRHITSC